MASTTRSPAGRWRSPRSWFYKWKNRIGVDAPTAREQRRARLDVEIARLFAASGGTYGSPRITQDLREAGWRVSENTVARRMAELGLAGRMPKKPRSLTRQGKRQAAPDLVRRTFTAVAADVQRVGRQLHHRKTKTPGSSAVMPLPPICGAALKLRAEQQATDRAQAGDAWIAHDLVITTRHGTPYEPRNFNRHFKLACERADVRYIKVHDTRRTCASLLVALDVHPRVAMQILRHSRIAVTMDIYSEVPAAATKDALKRLGDSLTG